MSVNNFNTYVKECRQLQDWNPFAFESNAITITQSFKLIFAQILSIATWELKKSRLYMCVLASQTYLCANIIYCHMGTQKVAFVYVCPRLAKVGHALVHNTTTSTRKSRKKVDNCRIRTYEGEPIWFLVKRLNHSAKLSYLTRFYIMHASMIISQQIGHLWVFFL